MIDFEELVISGKLGPIGEGANQEMIIKHFGTPEIFTPARKSYPMMLVYGDLEFRLRNNRLKTISLWLLEDPPNLPDTLTLDHLPSKFSRTVNVIEEILKEHQVQWKKDLIMSDEEQLVYITEKNVHLVFCGKILTKIVVGY